ncbi:hypothetical protein J1N35_007117 [Gossypium stocksii]|uniref:Aminotransferase-like plant mobile domain-containing protein n=1 Tax=Gossypium stocksii TaxID=47602 RepID=A0A9D3W5F2_9ROSI|nr:hypothetical protein J1N35_007117 [Gossypium stocksii]
MERWRSEIHTFHLPCGLTLEDISLQGLPINGEVVTGAVASADWSATCRTSLGVAELRWDGTNDLGIVFDAKTI